jgi:hypothetical protein
VSSFVTGRKLVALLDLHSEDRRKGKFASPEYLTKVPSNFTVTELLLKQIMVCYAETRNWFVQVTKLFKFFYTLLLTPRQNKLERFSPACLLEA